MNSMTNLLEFLAAIEERNIHFTLEHNRQEAIMVLLAVPGERWEVEFFTDGRIEVEVFRSVGMSGPEALERLFQEFSD